MVKQIYTKITFFILIDFTLRQLLILFFFSFHTLFLLVFNNVIFRELHWSQLGSIWPASSKSYPEIKHNTRVKQVSSVRNVCFGTVNRQKWETLGLFLHWVIFCPNFYPTFVVAQQPLGNCLHCEYSWKCLAGLERVSTRNFHFWLNYRAIEILIVLMQQMLTMFLLSLLKAKYCDCENYQPIRIKI